MFRFIILSIVLASQAYLYFRLRRFSKEQQLNPMVWQILSLLFIGVNLSIIPMIAI